MNTDNQITVRKDHSSVELKILRINSDVEPCGLRSAAPLSTVFRGVEPRPKRLPSPDRSRGRCGVGVKICVNLWSHKLG